MDENRERKRNLSSKISDEIWIKGMNIKYDRKEGKRRFWRRKIKKDERGG